MGSYRRFCFSGDWLTYCPAHLNYTPPGRLPLGYSVITPRWAGRQGAPERDRRIIIGSETSITPSDTDRPPPHILPNLRESLVNTPGSVHTGAAQQGGKKVERDAKTTVKRRPGTTRRSLLEVRTTVKGSQSPTVLLVLLVFLLLLLLSLVQT
ncbi:hypothetical protein O3P69_002194 [Scylla paramamosain]|uniref:Uncharacterized protein n=1 Tax=Scylla paramamosain TaxID=85552 RepID=A0AAW0V845_SCYPA